MFHLPANTCTMLMFHLSVRAGVSKKKNCFRKSPSFKWSSQIAWWIWMRNVSRLNFIMKKLYRHFKHLRCSSTGTTILEYNSRRETLRLSDEDCHQRMKQSCNQTVQQRWMINERHLYYYKTVKQPCLHIHDKKSPRIYRM